MKQRYFKKVGSLLLASAMVLTMFPTFSTSVHAEENQVPTKEQFATVDELKTFNTNDQDGAKNPAKVYFGNNNQQWWIAGSQTDDSVVLFATSPLTSEQRFEEKNEDKKYDENWKCTYLNGNPTDVSPNHYGASPLRTILQELETSYFTNAEQDLMNFTTVYTNDTKNNSVYSTTDKLYLAYGKENSQYITVGNNSADNLNAGLEIWKENYWYHDGEDDSFWLRTPRTNKPEYVLVASTVFQKVSYTLTGVNDPIIPAFELNLSSVLFSSTVPAVSFDGQQSTNDAFTLRYSADDLGSAQVSFDRSKVNLSNVPSGTYLVVQNKDGAYAKQITNETEVKVKEIDGALTTLENCKVWLEKTDSDQRMTYATMATEEQGSTVNITLAEGMEATSGGLTQKIGENKPIENVIINAKDDYMFPTDYTVEEQNGIIVTRDNENQITVSGTPTSDVNITLPPATKKIYSMTLDGNGTFTGTCVGYGPITANEFTITNNGNVDLENVNVSVTGTNAEQFELSWDKTATIQPNGTIKVTVKPKDGLAVHTYQATLSVSADNATDTTKTLQFTVSEHEYNAVVTPPTCTEKGYTTYTCKNCPHSYVGDEVPANGHTWGEWTIIDAPTCEQGGSRKHTCVDCGTVETENLNPNGHEWETEYTVDKEPTCTQDGSKSIHCKNCNAVKGSTTITKLGHSFTDYISNNDATCTKDGTKTAKCDRCDETDTIVDVGTMLEHEYEWVYNNDGTCEKNGTETGTCKHCPATITREKADTALGHDFKNYVSDNNATCTENGTETAKCERCDKTDTRIAENSVLGHKLGEWKIIKEATTTETGEKERVCERCDYKETEVIPMISKEEQPTTPTKPNIDDNNNTDKNNTSSKADKTDTAVKTGDSTNVLLWSMVAVISLAGVITALIFKRRRSR